MAWHCGSTANAGLVANLVSAGLIRHASVRDAMLSCDRSLFCLPCDAYSAAFRDTPLSIGHNATISAPHMHATCLEAIVEHLSRPGARVLDVGSGSGVFMAYAAAVAIPRGGEVHGVEHIQALVDFANHNLASCPVTAPWVASGKLQNVCGDGRKGFPPGPAGAYTVIHVGAAAPDIPPMLFDQVGGGVRWAGPLEGLVLHALYPSKIPPPPAPLPATIRSSRPAAASSSPSATPCRSSSPLTRTRRARSSATTSRTSVTFRFATPRSRWGAPTRADLSFLSPLCVCV